MPLTGAQHERLTDLVVLAFDAEGLHELVRFKLGADMYKDYVAPGHPFRHSGFLLLKALDERGLLTPFLKAVLAARPDRPDIQQEVPQIWPDVLQVTPSASAHVSVVERGVAAVTQRLPDAAVKQLVRDSAATLRKLSGDISLLRGYKSLHDCLHHLQMQILRRLGVAARRLLTDPEAADDLDQCRLGILTSMAQIDAAINSLPPSPPSLRKWEADWLERLKSVAQLAADSHSQGQPVVGLQSAQLLRRILRQEPARIDRYLRITAEAIDLEGLAALFQKAADLSAGAPEEKEFREGQQATDLLVRRLKALVNQHTHWQEIDSQLWEAEDYLPRTPTADAGDFQAFWTGLQKRVLMLAATEPTSSWAKNLSGASDTIEAQRMATDWNKVDAAYRRFRQDAVVQFFVVDSQLKTLAEEVGRIGDSLQQLLIGI